MTASLSRYALATKSPRALTAVARVSRVMLLTDLFHGKIPPRPF